MPVCKVTNKRIEALAADYTDRSDACRMSEGRWMMEEGRGKREDVRWMMEDVTQISQIIQINCLLMSVTFLRR